MKHSILILSLFSIALFSCNSTEKEEGNDSSVNVELSKKAISTLTANCYTCHNPNNVGENKVAPTMQEIQNLYLKKYKTKEEFVSNMNHFIENPAEENAIFSEAINKFGIMPNLSFSTEKANLISNYLYDNKVDTKEWIAANLYNNKTELPYEEENYAEKGMYFVMQTKPQLGKKLMKQIKTKGTVSAVSFCNLNALKIIDSMENVLNAKIKRVTDKPRNSNNQANDEELKYIELFKNNLTNGEKPKPITVENSAKINFYAPILTNGMCMQCHGNEKDVIKFEVKSILDSLYPNDKARGYLPNQIRGIWKVEFEK